jgi:hypothetical protein
MTFLILIILSFLIILVFRKYRSKYSVIIAVALIFGITTAVLIWGMTVIEKERVVHFFNSYISGDEFYYLMAAWYAADALCSALIIRNHTAYRKINMQKNAKSNTNSKH